MALSILGMGLITYLIRLSLFLLPDRVVLPPWLLRALRYVPAAVLSAIIFPELFLPNGALDISLGNERLSNRYRLAHAQRFYNRRCGDDRAVAPSGLQSLLALY